MALWLLLLFVSSVIAFTISAMSGGGAGLVLLPILRLALPASQVPAALSIDAEYVAFVGSRRKAEVLKEAMIKRGVAPERLARLKAPAGLDLGAITPDEIAISILAEIVQVRRGKRAGHCRSSA